MTGFFYICEYFGITPEDFFNQNKVLLPQKAQELKTEIDKLLPEEAEHLLLLVKDINKK